MELENHTVLSSSPCWGTSKLCDKSYHLSESQFCHLQSGNQERAFPVGPWGEQCPAQDESVNIGYRHGYRRMPVAALCAGTRASGFLSPHSSAPSWTWCWALSTTSWVSWTVSSSCFVLFSQPLLVPSRSRPGDSDAWEKDPGWWGCQTSLQTHRGLSDCRLEGESAWTFFLSPNTLPPSPRGRRPHPGPGGCGSGLGVGSLGWSPGPALAGVRT